MPIYLPEHPTAPSSAPTEDGWVQGPTNFLDIDPSKAFNGTWHDTTRHSTDPAPKEVRFSFKGVSIYVFCILANKVPFVDTLANYNFTINGDLVGSYRHEPEDTSDFVYNTLVYANETLENKDHNFSLVINSDGPAVLLLYDYAIYTMLDDEETTGSTSSTTTLPLSSSSLPETATSSSHSSAPSGATVPSANTNAPASKKNIAAIVGGTLGSIAFLLILITVLLLLRRRHSGARTSLPRYSECKSASPYSRPILFLPSPFPSDASPDLTVPASKHRREESTLDGSVPDTDSRHSRQLRQVTDELLDEVNELRRALRVLHQGHTRYDLEQPPAYSQ